VSTIYSWMYHANFVAALTKLFSSVSASVIWGVRHSLDDLGGESKSTKLAIYAGKFLRKVPKKVIYCSSKAMKQHIDFGYSYKNNSVYIPNGYEFEEPNLKTFNDKNLVIGAAGRFHKAKNYSMLFKSVAPILAANSNMKLKIAGRDIDYNNETIERYIRELSINIEQIELLGLVSDMPGFYRNVDFFVLSSITEGFPNVLAEAAGYGCIIFSTDVGDAKFIVNDDSRLVPVGQDKLLGSVLNDYINKSSEELSDISKCSSSYIRDTYSIETISKKILSIATEK
jgi:glycosyltransferase involved in cell wall biosynthesis